MKGNQQIPNNSALSSQQRSVNSYVFESGGVPSAQFNGPTATFQSTQQQLNYGQSTTPDGNRYGNYSVLVGSNTNTSAVHGQRQKSHGTEHSRNYSDTTHLLGAAEQLLAQGGMEGNMAGSVTDNNNFFSLRYNNHHMQSTDSNSQLEKLKKELAKVKRHNSKSRSQSRNGGPASSLKQVSANLKNEIITKYRARPDQPSTGGIGDKQLSTQSVSGGGAGSIQRGLSRSSSNLILQQTLVNNEKCVNTKVFARFRPLNKIEDELTKNQVGQDCCLYPDEKTVVLLPDQTVFTLDYVFDPNTSQHRIYEAVGHETISDVMNGYNGTIFAYGQTGSGKTYSMFGDIYKKNLKGLIPRSIEHIFKTINSCDVDIEFILTCSMLEIYKENLHDLLCTQKTDLKIKESPTRGIYVEGLTQLCVGTENELLTMLELGEQARRVAATRINQYSSRSHTIFMLEIKQRYSNDTEKKGKLNLVDLAGSEKVGKTGAMGDILEEAKKINLSLSCLGNVIHSLTTNSEHIPYRDSKLTRILQESLGGNFKTSLLVTCSSHSSSLEETLSTLKFATRAKSIKNNFKMNIKNSPESLQRIISQLKRDLLDAKTELDCIKRTNEIGLPNNEEGSAQSSSVQQMKPLFNRTQPNSAVALDNVHRNIILHEKIEGQTTELQDLRYLLKEQDDTIQKQEVQIEKLKRENLQLQERLSQAQQDKEVLHSKFQNSNLSSEKEMEQRTRDIALIEKSLNDLNKVVQDLMREKMEQSEMQLANIIGSGNQTYFGAIAELSNTDGLLEKERPANPLLRVKSNIHSTLKDIKYSIFNQRISSCRLREIAKKIEMQLHNSCNSQNVSVDGNTTSTADTTILNLLFYETLRIETLHSSLECSIRSLEIQESLNYQKYKIIVQKYEGEVKTSSSLQVILEKAMKTHSILRERIDNLEEDSAKHEDQKNLLTSDSVILHQGSPEKRRSKIIHSVQSNNSGNTHKLLLPTGSSNTSAKDSQQQLLDMLQDWFLEELQSYSRGFEGQSNLIQGISQEVHSAGLRSASALQQRIKEILGNQGIESKIHGENLSINQHIYVSENNRLQDKILVLMSELDLSNKQAEILEAELKKKSTEVIEVHELLRCTTEQSEKLQKEEFNKLRKQINESHVTTIDEQSISNNYCNNQKPIYQEILDFFKRQNSFTESLESRSTHSQMQLSQQLNQQHQNNSSSTHSQQSSSHKLSQQPSSMPTSSPNPTLTFNSSIRNQNSNTNGSSNQSRLTGNSSSATSSAISSVNSSAQRLPAPQYCVPTPTPSAYQNQNLKPNTTQKQLSNSSSTAQMPGVNQNPTILTINNSSNNNSSNGQIKTQPPTIGFRYDYSFLQDATAKSQNRPNNTAERSNTPTTPSYSTKY